MTKWVYPNDYDVITYAVSMPKGYALEGVWAYNKSDPSHKVIVPSKVVVEHQEQDRAAFKKLGVSERQLDEWDKEHQEQEKPYRGELADEEIEYFEHQEQEHHED